MRKFPSLKFLINPNMDFQVYNGFLATAEFSDIKKYLKIGFYDLYPELKKINKSRHNQKHKNQLIKKLIRQTCQRDSIQINNAIREAKKQWQKIKKAFFKQTFILFKNHPWPKGRYIAYLTIWGIYPRFLKNRVFLFPYQCRNKKFISFVIIHEMLHFIFYDYAIKKHSEIFKNLETEKGIFWDLAEIFNLVILSLPKFIKLHKQKNIPYYLEHKKYFSRFKKIWQQNQDIDIWLIKGYRYLKRQK